MFFYEPLNYDANVVVDNLIKLYISTMGLVCDSLGILILNLQL